MRGKTLGLIGLTPQDLPDTSRLQELHLQIQVTLTQIEQLEKVLEISVKRNEFTVLLGPYTLQLAKTLSLVFKQELAESEFGLVPRYARFLDANVLYVQTLIVTDLTKLDVVVRFLNGKKGGKPDDFDRFVCQDHVRKSIESIERCFNQFRPEEVFLSFNGGKDCTVLLHLVVHVLRRKSHSKRLLCLYVQSAQPFNELNDFVGECQTFYNLEVVTSRKDIKEALTDVLCKRKMKACLMGTRRTDPFSEHLETFQMTDPDWPQVIRVSPLLDWHYWQIWDYLLSLNVGYCKLYDLGYTSLGGVNNTVKNPTLRYNEDGNVKYLPAYKLLDGSRERFGRNAKSSDSKS